MALHDNDCAQVAIVGNVLEPLYLLDPKDAAARTMLQSLAQTDAAALAQDWPFGEPRVVASALRALVDEAQRSLDEPDVLVRAYRRLFVGPNHLVAPPWGSVYTDHEKVKFGESCLALRAWMRANGVASLSGASEPDDFIGTMLALLGWLASNKPQLVEEFLTDHLLTWSHHYLERLQQAAQMEHGFYVAAAQLTDATLQGMEAGFGLSVQYPRFYC